jgi:hypothetical protein
VGGNQDAEPFCEDGGVGSATWYRGWAYVDRLPAKGGVIHYFDAAGLGTFHALLDFKFNVLAFAEGTESSAIDGGIVDEDIIARCALDETIAFGIIEPFDGPSFSDVHFVILSLV